MSKLKEAFEAGFKKESNAEFGAEDLVYPVAGGALGALGGYGIARGLTGDAGSTSIDALMQGGMGSAGFIAGEEAANLHPTESESATNRYDDNFGPGLRMPKEYRESPLAPLYRWVRDEPMFPEHDFT